VERRLHRWSAGSDGWTCAPDHLVVIGASFTGGHGDAEGQGFGVNRLSNALGLGCLVCRPGTRLRAKAPAGDAEAGGLRCRTSASATPDNPLRWPRMVEGPPAARDAPLIGDEPADFPRQRRRTAKAPIVHTSSLVDGAQAVLATPAFTNGRPSSAGGVSEAKRLRTLEDENTRLKRLLADAMLDIVPCDAALVGPCQDSVAGEFAAVVTDHHPELTALHQPPVQFTHHADAGERGVSHQRQALAGTIINDGQNAESCRGS
jgi:hypothetical protein